MKRVYSLLFLALLFLVNCQPSDEDSVTIQGQVTDERTGVGLPGAAVIITSPDELGSNFASTDSSGNYSFGGITITQATDVTFRASQTGYVSATRSITIVPGQAFTLDFELEEEGSDSGGDTGGGDEPVVGGEPGVPAAIVLTDVSETAINIRQTGGTVNTTFSFIVQDSSGRNMNEDTPVEVNFRIIKGPGGGEAVVPERVETNDEGAVVSNLFSGDSAGVVRLEAFIERNDGVRIASTPILIAINGGFPAADRFFVAPINYNVEGYGYLDPGISYAITASVGDRYGNPVKVGTAVDFRTEAGRIDGSAITDERGFASVQLSPDGSSPGSGTADVGFFNITAKTVDEDNEYIEKDIRMLFTTREAIITFTSGAFDIPANGSDNISFTVTDLNGRPMAAGSTISVSSQGDIEITGDSNIKLGDFFTGGPGRTTFTVTAQDVDDLNNTAQGASVTVTVSTPSGNTTSATITGTRRKVIGN
ncbi:MAG: carboxypeptidase regulatory-like domain-containing protein [Balneolaceae bacterium]|nr:carboxypeptidase regulatory-like domain-containing protein [Balneolaceae bacterium]MBO6546155.1 carboxypeptidase regulatory-like domain-containing protein [Balneolaceae bacterium]MBO6648513.1 carboxypeptidase regulatory-like domain-containing protein [Balneolaceae bacterium]